MANWDQAPAVGAAGGGSKWQAAPAVGAAATAPASAPTATTSDPQARYDAALNAIKTHYGLDDVAVKRLSDQYSPDIWNLARAGTTFGLADELSGAAGFMGNLLHNPSQAYGDYSELENAALNLARQKSGIPGAVVEGASSLATLGPERAALDLIANGGQAAVKVAPSLLKTALTSGGTGAAIGGIGGFTSTDGGVGDRLVGAAKGGLGGAVVGTALPVVARGASEVVDALLNSGAAKDAAAKLGMSPEAAKFMQTQMATDNTLGPSGGARMAAAGPEATLADAGPAARNVLDYAIQNSGQAGAAARTAIDTRVSRESSAISDALDTAFGKPVGVDTARASIRSASAPARDAAYKAAYAQPIDYASEDGRQIESLLQRVPRAAIDRANLLMKAKGETSGQIMAQVADDGSVSFKTMPDVRQLDYITRALNEEAQHGVGAGAMGGQTALGSALTTLSGDIRDILRLHVPEYGDALAVGQDTIQQTQAAKNGYDLLSPSTTREDVAAWTKGMSPEARTAAAQGVRSRISDAVSNVTRTLTDGDVPAREALKVLRDLSSTAARDKVASVIGQAQADTLFAKLDRATKSFELRAGVADNSKTFQRQAMDRQVNATVDSSGVVNTLLKGEPVNAGKRAVQFVTGATPERAQAAKDQMMQEVVKALVARGPGAVGTAQALSKLGTQRGNAAAVRQAILNVGALSGPAAGLVGQRAGASQ